MSVFTGNSNPELAHESRLRGQRQRRVEPALGEGLAQMDVELVVERRDPLLAAGSDLS